MKGQVSEALEPAFFLGGSAIAHDFSERSTENIFQIYNLIYQTYKKNMLICFVSLVTPGEKPPGMVKADRGIHTTLRLWLDFGAAT